MMERRPIAALLSNSPSIESGRAARRAELQAIVTRTDPVEANRGITAGHHRLSQLLDATLGPDAGANFHTWAVWGSREAGRTIARRDVAGLTGLVAAVGAMLAAALAWPTGWPVVPTAVGAAAVFGLATRLLLDRSSRHISHGNRMVLDEIGGVTVDFVAAVDAQERGDLGAVDRFLAGLDDGPTEHGGQDLLREAFRAYAAARDETARDRHQLVFAANCFAVRHEHIRLQPDIRQAMPWPLRRWITRHLLDFWVGSEHLHVGVDLGPVGAAAFPETLSRLRCQEALRAVADLRDPGRADATLAASGAGDWSCLADRMNYVVDLFRSRHLSPEVFADPYPPRRGDGPERRQPLRRRLPSR